MIGWSEKGETVQGNYMEVLLTLKPDVEEIETLAHGMTKALQKEFSYVQFIPHSLLPCVLKNF